jgi:class 3 adenylate cyclase
VRALRPITAAALPDDATVDSTHDTAPSVMVRLLSVWVLISALPSFGVAGLILARSNGWLIDRSASLELPILLLMAVGVLWGLRAMILVSQSISDPVRDVVEAMADVGQGNLEHTVSVYERSEVGRLQTGFNRMVIGLRERELLRDLFGRNVGGDVVSLLVNRDESSYGVERDVAVMFIDLAGSTQLAASLPPQQVAELLNTFFQSVVLAVDNHGGFVNKFQGDAALAVFGAPVDSPTAYRRTGHRTRTRGPDARAAGARLRHRGGGRTGVRRIRRSPEPVRVHRDRGRGQRIGPAGRPRQTGAGAGAVFGRRPARRRHR